MAYLLERRLKGYRQHDANAKQQKETSCNFHKNLHSEVPTVTKQGLTEMATGAFFFAMRCCKYVKVSGQRKTWLLEQKNIAFHLEDKRLQHDDPHST